MELSLENKSLLNKAIKVVEELEKKAKMFSKGMLALSLFDVVFGILALFLTSLQLTALFMSASSLTAIAVCGRVIQLSKLQSFNKSLRTLNFVSIAWFVNKYNKNKERRARMENTKKLTAQHWIAIAGGVAGIIFAIVSFFVPEIVMFGDLAYNIGIALGIESIAVFVGTFKDKADMTAEEIAKYKTKNESKIVAAETKKRLAEQQEATYKTIEAQVKAEITAK